MRDQREGLRGRGRGVPPPKSIRTHPALIDLSDVVRLCSPVQGIGRFTTEEEVDFAVELLAHHVERLRSMSPLWEMVQEGIDIKTIQWSQDAH